MEKAVQSLQTSDIGRDIRDFLVAHFLSGRAENLRDDGSLLGNAVDSLGVLDLVTFLQDHFQITVEDEDVVPGNLDTVNNLIAFVARKLHAKEQV
ncbi:MAG TPA: acyl carrier protein [Candidatus Acidoferrum sp.]|jgi:acyl carrier protein|nr:acyl carrier protein [Candidatus Acidoferrum sp.]